MFLISNILHHVNNSSSTSRTRAQYNHKLLIHTHIQKVLWDYFLNATFSFDFPWNIDLCCKALGLNFFSV